VYVLKVPSLTGAVQIMFTSLKPEGIYVQDIGTILVMFHIGVITGQSIHNRLAEILTTVCAAVP